jgi:polysaccharide export outer membrane protein
MRVSSLWVRLAFALALPVLVSGCASNGGQGGQTASAGNMGSGEYPVSAPQEATAEQPAAAAMASTDPGEYRISANDSLQIAVFQVQDLNQTVKVNVDGSITLPLVGKVMVAGKTTHEAELLIADLLRKKYLQSPQVSISIAKFGQRVTVSGAVKQPRVLAVDGQLTLTQAIANAGGLSDLADSTRVHVARRAAGQHVEDRIFNLDFIQSGKTIDPKLEGGDMVVAEESGTKVALKNVKDLLPFAVFATIF